MGVQTNINSLECRLFSLALAVQKFCLRLEHLSRLRFLSALTYSKYLFWGPLSRELFLSRTGKCSGDQPLR